MPKLNQVLAAEKIIQASTLTAVTAAYRAAAKTQLMEGLTRTYQPRDEDGDTLPSETRRVQLTANQLVKQVFDAMATHIDVVATKDAGNMNVSAPVICDGVEVTPPLPTTHLLWLDKQLVGLHTFVKSLPTLDPADAWVPDQATGVWRTPEVQTTRTKKTPRNHVKAWPTAEHPNIVPQVETFTEDQIIGDWKAVKFSGAMPAETVQRLVGRVETLQIGVKAAIQAANGETVGKQQIAAGIFGYLLG